MKMLVRQHPELNDLKTHFSTSAKRGFSGTALHLASQLRNRLTHGAMSFEDTPASRGGVPELDFQLARAGTRGILYSIQMLMIAAFDSPDMTIETYSDELDEDVLVPVSKFFFTVHLDTDHLVREVG